MTRHVVLITNPTSSIENNFITKPILKKYIVRDQRADAGINAKMTWPGRPTIQAAIAQLGECRTEDLKVPGSILVLGSLLYSGTQALVFVPGNAENKPWIEKAVDGFAGLYSNRHASMSKNKFVNIS